MRTALFYSCKGGSGRTLTLANIAWLLVRLGNSVLCLDLDLEAPGIPEALGTELLTSAGDARANEGFLEYALVQLAGAEVAGTDAATTDSLNVLPVKGEAKLRVIRAGDYVTGAGFAKYVRIIRSGTLEGIYAPPEPAAKTDDELVETYKSFWSQLRAALAGYKPDYLLIDTRTGFSPLSTTTIDELFGPAQEELSDALDLFVFAEQGSEASRRGTQVFLRTLGEERNEGLLPRLTIVRRETPLMKRVTDADSPAESIEEWLVRGDEEPWNNLIRPDSCWTISSDPLVERTGENLSTPGPDLPKRRLLDDYVRLVARLAREEVKTTRKRLGLMDETPMNYRLFELPPGGGLHNIADAQPNISFTIATFQRFAAALVEARSTTDQPLKKLGVEAGDEYGGMLLKQASGDRILALEEWLKIDSSVGWGHFELVPPEPYKFLATIQRMVHGPSLAEPERPARVVVSENVFAPRDSESGNLCGFLGAYIAGIVSKLSGVAMEPAEHPICQSQKESACEFAFTPSDGENSAAVG